MLVSSSRSSMSRPTSKSVRISDFAWCTRTPGLPDAKTFTTARLTASSASNAAGTHTAVSSPVGEGEAEQVAAARRADPKRADGDRLVPGANAVSVSTAPFASTSATSAVSRPSVGWLSTMGASSTSARRSNSERNSRNSKRCFTSPRSGGCTPSAAMLPRSTSIGASRRSTMTSAFLRTRVSFAARLSRSLGVCLSRLAKMPSSPP